ncbi:MAG: TonB-dependent receptor [Bacteroidota bacterium]|nr:TonB-dependent receptor [Bacteroidota bacterium]
MKNFAVILFSSLFAYAQQVDLDALKITDSTKYIINEVVITATRSKKLTNDVGRSVNVINNDQLKNSLANSIGEVIGQQTGMYVVGAGQNPGMTQTIFTRGASSNHTTLMVDGVRVADPSTVNNAPDLSELSTIGIDHLEIVRGAHSTLFGSSAIGGVINFISQNSNTPGFHLNSDIASGIFGKNTSSFSENLVVQYSFTSGLYLNAGISNQKVKGLDATIDTVTNQQFFKNRDKDGFEKTNLFGKIGFENEQMSFHFSYKYNLQKADIDRSAFSDDDNYTLDFYRNLFTYGASYNFNDAFSMHYIGGYSLMERNSINDSSFVDNIGNYDHTFVGSLYNGATITNEFQNDFRFNGIDGIIGIGLYKETMNNKTHFYSWSPFGVYQADTDLDSLNLQSTTKSIFVHTNINGLIVDESLQDLSISLGSRLNNHDGFGSNVTYEINPSFKIFDNSLLFVSYATGFNAPSLYQLYARDSYYASTITRGNKNLKPEESRSYEIGLKQSLGTNVNVSLIYFNTIVENFIEYVYLWDKNIGIDTLGNNFLRDDYRGDTYLNLGKQDNTGFELTVSAQITDQLYFSANANFITGKLTYQSSDINTAQTEGNHVQIYSNGAFLNKNVETKGLVRRPNTANLHLKYLPIEELALSIDVKIVGARDDVYYESTLGPYGALGNVRVDSYTVIDFSQKFKISENFSVNGRIENLFDTKYYEIKGFTTRGRGLFLKLSYQL